MAHDEQEDDPTVWHVRELEHGWWHKLEPETQRWFFVVRSPRRATARAAARAARGHPAGFEFRTSRAQHEDGREPQWEMPGELEPSSFWTQPSEGTSAEASQTHSSEEDDEEDEEEEEEEEEEEGSQEGDAGVHEEEWRPGGGGGSHNKKRRPAALGSHASAPKKPRKEAQSKQQPKEQPAAPSLGVKPLSKDEENTLRAALEMRPREQWPRDWVGCVRARARLRSALSPQTLPMPLRSHVQLLDRTVTPGGSALANGMQSIIFSRKYDKSGAPLRLLLRRCVRATTPSSPLASQTTTTAASQLCDTSGRAARGRARRKERDRQLRDQLGEPLRARALGVYGRPRGSRPGRLDGARRGERE